MLHEVPGLRLVLVVSKILSEASLSLWSNAVGIAAPIVLLVLVMLRYNTRHERHSVHPAAANE